MTWGPLWDDYARFHALAIETGDVDPVYPLLKALAPSYGPQGMAWLSFLHVAYYDLGSAIRAYHTLGLRRPSQGALEQVLRLRCGTERRGHRSPRQLHAHLCALFDLGEHYGDHYMAVRVISSRSGIAPRYGDLLGGMLSIRGNGRWAAYKTCELMSHSLQQYLGTDALALEPTNMGMRYSSGPRHGLHLLDPSLPTNESVLAIRRLDAAAVRLVEDLTRSFIPASMATAETTLCDFHSLVKGRYYVGHDIDQMRLQLRRAMYDDPTGPAFEALEQAYHAAAECFPPAYWGHEPDRVRRSHYARTGEILTRW